MCLGVRFIDVLEASIWLRYVQCAVINIHKYHFTSAIEKSEGRELSPFTWERAGVSRKCRV